MRAVKVEDLGGRVFQQRDIVSTALTRLSLTKGLMTRCDEPSSLAKSNFSLEVCESHAVNKRSTSWAGRSGDACETPHSYTFAPCNFGRQQMPLGCHFEFQVFASWYQFAVLCGCRCTQAPLQSGRPCQGSRHWKLCGCLLIRQMSPNSNRSLNLRPGN